MKSALTALAILLTACSSGNTTTQESKVAGSRTKPVLFVPGNPATGRDPIGIRNATIENGQLLVDIVHMGGCREHDYSFQIQDGFLESFPVQVIGAVVDNSKEFDPCKALIHKRLFFSLSPLAERYQEAYGHGAGEILLRIVGHNSVVFRF